MPLLGSNILEAEKARTQSALFYGAGTQLFAFASMRVLPY